MVNTEKTLGFEFRKSGSIYPIPFLAARSWKAKQHTYSIVGIQSIGTTYHGVIEKNSTKLDSKSLKGRSTGE